ncbi:MAG: DHHA1 domain-containing protein, partial [Candidatus Nanohaloarchaea archaeon]|nr:DHHA1 domain-containing protein [Candidatus Nanohaloarchaea archaeon]
DPNMIGTVTTISQKSDIVPKEVLVGLSWKDEEHTKISARAKDKVVEQGLKMNELMEELSERFDGEGGGHEAAAGGKIPREKEGEFVQAFIETVEERL